jgi:acetyltransferase-like isoleucine patch superfamily enzyme
MKNIEIGPWSIVPGGSTIVKDAPKNTMVMGVPGKVIRTRPDALPMKQLHND